VSLAQTSPVEVALTSVLAASGAALVLLGAAARPWRGRAQATSAWGAPLALGLAFAAAFLCSRTPPPLLPQRSEQWLFHLALAAAAYGLYEAVGGRRSALTRALFAVLVPVVLLEFQRKGHWGRTEGVLWTGGLAALLFVSWQAGAARESAAKSGAGALGLALGTALAAATYGKAGATLYALLPGALALATGAVALLGIWRRASGLGPAGVAPFVVLYFATLWLARFLYELGTPAFALLSLVPLGASAAALVPASRPKLRELASVLGPMLPAAAALGIELASAPPASPYG